MGIVPAERIELPSLRCKRRALPLDEAGEELMDPNANLEEQRELAAKIIKDFDVGLGPTSLDANRLAELVQALDYWLTQGGFFPTEWGIRYTGS